MAPASSFHGSRASERSQTFRHRQWVPLESPAMADQLHGEQSNQDICQEAVLSCAVSASRLVAKKNGALMRVRSVARAYWPGRAHVARHSSTGRSEPWERGLGEVRDLALHSSRPDRRARGALVAAAWAEGRQKSVRIVYTLARPALICSRAGVGLPLDAASCPYWLLSFPPRPCA